MDSNHGPAEQNYRDRTHSFGLSDSPKHCIYRVLVAPRTVECRPTGPARGGGGVPFLEMFGEFKCVLNSCPSRVFSPSLNLLLLCGADRKGEVEPPKAIRKYRLKGEQKPLLTDGGHTRELAFLVLPLSLRRCPGQSCALSGVSGGKS